MAAPRMPASCLGLTFVRNMCRALQCTFETRGGVNCWPVARKSFLSLPYTRWAQPREARAGWQGDDGRGPWARSAP
eukprot:scaffold1_cov402-Prasinococcus_capsulatus_cf.AAC.53